MKNWNIDILTASLKTAVTKKSIYQWRVSVSDMHRKEFYLIQGLSDAAATLDQNRTVSQQTVMASVWVEKENDKCGVGTIELYTHSDLQEQLDNLIESAELSTQGFWRFPESPERVSRQSITSYHPFVENLDESANLVCKSLYKEIELIQEAQFNSAELFVEVFKKRQILSNGFEGSYEASKIYAEVCFSYKDTTGESEEFLITEYGACPEQIDFKKMCENSAMYAKKSLETKKPKSGAMPVIIEADVLGTLIADLAVQMNSAHKYFSYPFIEKGQEIIPDFEGEEFSVYVDPHLDYGFGSQAFDQSGLCATKTLIMEGNKVRENLCSVEMGQLLKRKPSITQGNFVIETKGSPYKDLCVDSEEVLEVLQFSGLFTDPMSLTFSSEIRLARIYNKKTGDFSYVKGGSLSGNIKDNFKTIKFSKEKGLKNLSGGFGQNGLGYYGPKFALLTQVQISS